MQVENLIGKTLAIYRLEAVLEQGENTVLFKAWDPIRLRSVGILVLSPMQTSGSPGLPPQKTSFIQKARALVSWNNDHIRQVYYAGEQDGLTFAAIELLEGQTLSERLGDAAQYGVYLPVFEVLQYGRAIADALDYAHLRGVAHGELHPGNIFILPDGRVVLDGFLRDRDTIHLTPFSAPEQINQPNFYTTQSDLFSFGALLYNMLTGQKPYPERVPLVERGETIPLPAPADEVNPELNERVDAVLLQSMMYDPDQRYHNGAEVIEALQVSLIGGRLPFQIPPSPKQGDQPRSLFDLPAETIQMTEESLSAEKNFISHNNQNRLVLIFGLFGLAAIALILFIGMVQNYRNSIQSINIDAVITIKAEIPSSPTQPTRTEKILPAVAPTATIVVANAIVTASPGSLAPQVAGSPFPTSTISLATDELSSTRLPAETSTPIFLEGRHFILFYNDTSFYMLQSEGFQRGPIEPVLFERLDQEGNPTDRFPGINFSFYHPNTALGYCMRIEIQDAQDYLRPEECKGYLVTRWPAPDSDMIFWTKEEGSTQFRVSWNHTEVAHCEIAAGVCDVFLP